MQICEFHRYYGRHDQEYFDGRWQLDQCGAGETKPDQTACLVTDLFRKEECSIFVPKQSRRHYFFEFFQLNKQYGLMYGHRENDDTLHNSFWVVEFDSESKEYTVGEYGFETPDGETHWKIIVDSAGQYTNGGLNFLFYSNATDLLQYCRIDAKECRILSNGAKFELPVEDFNRMTLHNGIIFGLPTDLTTINRFDLKSRKSMDKIQTLGLPSALQGSYLDTWYRNDGCLKYDNQLFLWSTENRNCSSYLLYRVQLDTGVATPFTYKFQHPIIKLWQNSDDGNLYVQTKKRIGSGKYSEQGDILCHWSESYSPSSLEYRFYRIPLNTPESLFFTAFKNVPRPLPPIIEKLAMQRKDLPLNVYN